MASQHTQHTGMVMSQYSQWLYHREVDQQLREHLELLEQELHSLQEQAVLLEDAASNTENPILQAIAMQQSAEALLEDTSVPSSAQQLPESEEQASKSVSSALFAWSHLPNLDTQKVPLAANALATSEVDGIRQPSLPYPEVNLLPSDMATFIDTHQQTSPQTRLPKWLRHATPVAHTTEQPKPAPSAPDERTDASIRRWLQRWGKQLPDSPPAQKPQEVYKHE
jgi:hypothetical protein